jgi:hypothetical protein
MMKRIARVPTTCLLHPSQRGGLPSSLRVSRSLFCFKEDLQDRMYDAHVKNKKIHQRQKAMMVQMNLHVSNGSENIITPPEEGKSSTSGLALRTPSPNGLKLKVMMRRKI